MVRDNNNVLTLDQLAAQNGCTTSRGGALPVHTHTRTGCLSASTYSRLCSAEDPADSAAAAAVEPSGAPMSVTLWSVRSRVSRVRVLGASATASTCSCSKV